MTAFLAIARADIAGFDPAARLAAAVVAVVGRPEDHRESWASVACSVQCQKKARLTAAATVATYFQDHPRGCRTAAVVVAKQRQIVHLPAAAVVAGCSAQGY